MRILLSLIVALLTMAPPGARAQQLVTDAASAGWQAIQNNDGEQALRLFDAALTTRPDDPVLHLGAGAAAHMLGRDDEAMRALNVALSHDPALVVASRLLAEIAWQHGDLPLAIETYQRALAYTPADSELASRLDRLQQEAGRKRARAQLQIAVTGPQQAAVVERAARVLNGAYWDVAKLVGAYPAELITIDLDTTQPFDARRPVAAGDDRLAVVGAAGALNDPPAFDRVLTAALVHAMVHQMAPTGVPAWFASGLAQVVSTADPALARRRLRGLAAIPWARFDAAALPAVADAQADADASLLIVRALLARIGAKSTQLLDGLADGQSLDAALAPFGFSWADLKADVLQSLEQ